MRDNKILAWLMLALGLFSLGLGVIAGKPEYYSDVFFFYAFLGYAKIRDHQLEQETSCANCERRAEFCKCCCDRIADGKDAAVRDDGAGAAA